MLIGSCCFEEIYKETLSIRKYVTKSKLLVGFCKSCIMKHFSRKVLLFPSWRRKKMCHPKLAFICLINLREEQPSGVQEVRFKSKCLKFITVKYSALILLSITNCRSTECCFLSNVKSKTTEVVKNNKSTFLKEMSPVDCELNSNVF